MASAKRKSAKKKGKNGALAVEIGAGALAAAAAAGAGYYFYGDKKAKKHRQAAAKWAKDMQKDVIKNAKKVQKLDRQAVAAIVDSASKAYVTSRNVKKEDVIRAANELKANWKELEAELRTAAKRGAKSVSKPVKKAVKKAKKAVKKAAPKKVAKKKSAKKKK